MLLSVPQRRVQSPLRLLLGAEGVQRCDLQLVRHDVVVSPPSPVRCWWRCHQRGARARARHITRVADRTDGCLQYPEAVEGVVLPAAEVVAFPCLRLRLLTTIHPEVPELEKCEHLRLLRRPVVRLVLRYHAGNQRRHDIAARRVPRSDAGDEDATPARYRRTARTAELSTR